MIKIGKILLAFIFIIVLVILLEIGGDGGGDQAIEVKGSVILSDLDPVSGATVTFLTNDGNNTVIVSGITNGAGAFDLTFPVSYDSGAYIMTVEATGYETVKIIPVLQRGLNSLTSTIPERVSPALEKRDVQI
jgi:subtilisin family serine protease